MEKEENGPEQEEDIEEKDEREKMLEDEEISSAEEGFVEGYEQDEEKSMEEGSQDND